MPEKSPELIITKLFPPISRSGLVDRTRLTRTMDKTRLRRLTLVSAPAGFGKSTLLAQWQHTLADAGVKVCWLSADTDDRNVEYFLRYIIAALQNIQPDLANRATDLLTNQNHVDTAMVIARIVNDVAEFGHQIALFIDDYHLADSPAVNQALQILLNRAPDNFHFIIASRAIPSLPIATLRVHDDVVELTTTDLRFDLQESDSFIRNTRALDLNAEQIGLLQDRTEGWAAGLQLASLSLKNPDHRDSFFASFSGTLRDITDYLATDVLQRLSEDEQLFLLQTSVLERMNADLCNTVTGRTDSQRLIDNLEACNLFILPLDQNRVWYRYHHLFADFLRGQLDQKRGLEKKRLQTRASRWFAEQGFPDEAVTYALDAENFDEAAELVEAHASRLLFQGEMVRLNSWLSKIPETLAARYPRLPIYHCWALFHMRRPREAAEAIKRADAALTNLERKARACNDLSEIARLRDLREEEKVLKAGVAISFDDIDATKKLASVAITNQTDDDNIWLNGVMGNIYGYACQASSDFPAAREALGRARIMHERRGSSFGTIYSDCFLGLTELAEGNLYKAAALFRQAEDVSFRAGLGQRTPGTAVAIVLRGVVLYEWGRLDDAATLIETDLDVVEECSHIEAENMARITLARIYALRGNRDATESVLQKAQEICVTEGVARQLVQVFDERVRVALYFGDPQTAFEIADNMRLDLDGDPKCHTDRWDRIIYVRDLIRARLLIIHGSHARALANLEQLAKVARHFGRRRRIVQALCLQSLALYQADRTDEAFDVFAEVIALACPEGYVRTICDVGMGIDKLIIALRKRWQDHGKDKSVALRRHLDQLAREPDIAPDNPSKPAAHASGFDSLVEPLSVREQDVLVLLAEGRANREISKNLGITENTVKWHIKNIFEKLGATNRTAAVRRSRDLGLVV